MGNVYNGGSGAAAELFVLAEANKWLKKNKQTNKSWEVFLLLPPSGQSKVCRKLKVMLLYWLSSRVRCSCTRSLPNSTFNWKVLVNVAIFSFRVISRKTQLWASHVLWSRSQPPVWPALEDRSHYFIQISGPRPNKADLTEKQAEKMHSEAYTIAIKTTSAGSCVCCEARSLEWRRSLV